VAWRAHACHLRLAVLPLAGPRRWRGWSVRHGSGKPAIHHGWHLFTFALNARWFTAQSAHTCRPQAATDCDRFVDGSAPFVMKWLHIYYIIGGIHSIPGDARCASVPEAASSGAGRNRPFLDLGLTPLRSSLTMTGTDDQDI
jgi:hypothetical protein